MIQYGSNRRAWLWAWVLTVWLGLVVAAYVQGVRTTEREAAEERARVVGSAVTAAPSAAGEGSRGHD